MTLVEGRNRQIRRMFEEIGHHVEKIKRVVLRARCNWMSKPGKFRHLTSKEVGQLKAAVRKEEDERRVDDRIFESWCPKHVQQLASYKPGKHCGRQNWRPECAASRWPRTRIRSGLRRWRSTPSKRPPPISISIPTPTRPNCRAAGGDPRARAEPDSGHRGLDDVSRDHCAYAAGSGAERRHQQACRSSSIRW